MLIKKELCRFNNVSHPYGSNGKLDNVSFFLFQGERIALLGSAESGSTLIARILGRQKPDIDGAEWFTIPSCFFISRISRLIPDLSISENLCIISRKGKKLNWFSFDKHAKILARFLEQHSITVDLSKSVSALSRFEHLYLQIICAVLSDVNLLVIEEGLDYLTQVEKEQLHALLDKFPSTTVVYCAFSDQAILKKTDRIFYLQDGSLLQILDVSDDDFNHTTENKIELTEDLLIKAKSESCSSTRDSIPGKTSLQYCSGEIPLCPGKLAAVIDRDHMISFYSSSLALGTCAIKTGEGLLRTWKDASQRGFSVLTYRSITNSYFPCFDRTVNIAFQAETKFGLFHFTSTDMDDYLVQKYNPDPSYSRNFISTYFEQAKLLFLRWEASKPKGMIIDNLYKGFNSVQRKWFESRMIRLVQAGTAVLYIADIPYDITENCYDSIYSI